MQSYWTLVNISLTSMSIGMATLVLVIFYYYHSVWGLPPGPIGIPFFGYWPFISPKRYQQQFDQLTKKYGDIFSFWSTGKLYISLGSTRAIREAHVTQTDCFGKRMDEFSLLKNTFSDSVGTIHGDPWKVTRKFLVQAMRDRVSASLKGLLYESVQSAVDELKRKRDHTINIVEFLTAKSVNIINLTLFNEDDRGAIGEISLCYARMTSCFTGRNLLATGMIAKYIIFPLIAGYKRRELNLKRIQSILYEIIDEHSRTYHEDHIRDIFDEFIKERRSRQRKGDPTYLYFTDKTLMSTLVQVIGDGTVLTSAFICHFIESLIIHPEEQEKIYQELMEAVGPDRQPDIEDKNRLTYTNAFIREAQRTSHFSTFIPSMECTKETTLRGYRIPKGAITLLNVFSAHHDPETYVNPYKFDPSRFLATEKKTKSEPLVQFGLGKRSCIGESFVMLQLFLLLTTLVKNLRFLPPKEVNDNFQLLQRGQLMVRIQPRN